MFKCFVLISVIAFCKADQYFHMSIDHSPDGQFKSITEPKPIEQKKLVQSSGYKAPVTVQKKVGHSSGYTAPATIQKKIGQSSGYTSPVTAQKNVVQSSGYTTPVTAQKKVAESSGYLLTVAKRKKSDKSDRTGYVLPNKYEYVEEDGVEDTGYSAPYGYERSLYERQSYQRPSYSPNYAQGYDNNMYVQKEYASPISTFRNVEIRPVQSSGGYDQKDHMIDVKDDTPIVIHFRTHANHIKVEQTRVPDKPREVEHTRSEDEPHRVIHEVYKPVIQEIREIIQPFRKVVQQVQPVVEEVQTIVHKSDGRRNRGGGGGDGGSGEGGSGQPEYGDRVPYGRKKSTGGSNKKYNNLKDYLPQGSVHSIRGVPIYRSQYKGPAIPQKKH